MRSIRRARSSRCIASSPSWPAEAGVSERTLWRWLQAEPFKAAYDEARQALVSHAVTRLQVATELAVNTLRDVMENRINSASARVAAAKTVLDIAMGLGGTGDEDLSGRLDELEEHIRRIYG